MMKLVKILGWMLRLLRLLFASALFIAFITPSWVLAQSSDDGWTVPVNVSHSGGATNPAIVRDSEGILHVIWQDNLQKIIHTQFDGAQWSSPELTDLDRLFTVPVAGEPTPRGSQPWIYTGPNPLLVAGPDQYIFAFWLSAQGRLFTSRVKNVNFDHVSAWESEGVVANQAASFSVAIDASGEWHLAYLRTATDILHPAGIYYTHSRNGGVSWTLPVLLYQSPYFGHLAVGEANLSLAIAEAEGAQHVYIAWDNRPRKQVLLAQSADSGKSWEQPMLVAGPASDSGSAGPLNIQVGVIKNSIVLVWQNGRATNGLLPACSQIYQSSSDAGATWTDPQSMIENMVGCTQSNKFVTGLANSAEGTLYFLTETKSQFFLTAWNGNQWSQMQEQPILSGFEEPEIYTEVIYSCHQASLSGARLYIVGCDQGEGGDIWVTSREMGSDSSWFQPPAWSQLSPVTTDSLKMESIELVDTDDGFFHAFFSQDGDRSIYYTYWNGEAWSRINPVLELPEGEMAWPAVAAAPGHELFLVARSNNGTVYLSRATSGNTATESHWSAPTKLEIGHDGKIGSVDVVSDPAGTLYLAYSVPVNDERGIYLVQSKDHGTSWGEPVQVFDGAAAGFEVVGGPSLLRSENGFLHIVWKQEAIGGDGIPQPLSLYYTRSADEGQTFSKATPIIKEPVAWREIMTDGKGNLHLLWQTQDALTTVWDQASMDDGITWQYPQGLPNRGSLEAATTDIAGRLHLVDVGPDALGHWLWDGSGWQNEESLRWPLSSQPTSPAQLLAAAVNKQGKMMVVVAEPTGEGEGKAMTLYYAIHALKLPKQPTAIQEIATQAPLTPTLIPATATPAQLLTPTALVDNPSATEDQIVHVEPNNRMSSIATATLPVAVLLLSVMGFVIWRAIQLKDR